MQNFDKRVGEIEKIIGYTFKDKSLLRQAFTRTSYCNEHKILGGERLQSNEVLEFFGDGVLSVAIISFMLKACTERYAYGIKTDLTEGDFSNIKSKLSDKKNLSACAMSLGLGAYLNIGEGDAKLGIVNEPSVMEDLFESIIGAVYIDCGMSIPQVMRVVEKMLDVNEYISKAPPIQSAKNALQEWCADKKRRLPQPVYRTLGEDGPDHKKTYVRGCYIGERLVARGMGKNLKLADASAAESALGILIAEEENKREAEKKKAPPKKKPESVEAVKEPKKPEPKKKAEPKETTEPEKEEPAQPKKQPPKKKAKETAKKRPLAAKQEDAPKAEPKSTAKKEPTSPKKGAKKQTTVGTEPKPGQLKSKNNSTRVQPSSSQEAKKPSGDSAITVLKNYASKQHIATPAFKDLGEAKGKSGAVEFRIECHFADKIATATAPTRAEARELAARRIADAIKPPRKRNTKGK
ncbi:MAG: hypothetical protein IJY24_03725 [Clostridia bacterium]|nr:hypothetical protein [Clostridia bacterium]